MRRKQYSVEESSRRFWSHVQITASCWVWTGGIDRKGYGYCYPYPRGTDGKSRHVLSHRYAYELFFGTIAPGMVICHACDNPRCVRPDHLWAGTMAQNQQDMARKQRNPRGSQHWYARLTESTVREIRALYATGQWTYQELGERFHVRDSTIGYIVRGQTWRHVA